MCHLGACTVADRHPLRKWRKIENPPYTECGSCVTFRETSNTGVGEGGVLVVSGAINEQGRAMGLKGFLKRSACAGLAAGALTGGLVIASPATSGAASSPSSGTLTMAIDQTLAGFNVNTSAASEYVLQEILDVVWPQPFIITSKLKAALNSDLLTSATSTGTSPQTVTYTLNPKAVWQDGVGITADDFIYNWQAQSANKAFTDVGGATYDAASSSGYNQILSIKGSHPSGGAACDPGSAANRNLGLCPNGRTVTVTFKPAYADWQSLFGNLVPAHISRTAGWNTGLNNFTKVLSGSWYEIKSYTEGQSLVLQQNPSYWGTPGHLKTIVFQFITDDTQETPALQNNEVQIINPATVNLSIVQNTSQLSNINKVITPGLEFEHFDFNEANPYLAKLPIRQAIALGTDRKQLIARTVGEVSKGIKPLGNRMYVSSQPQYVDHGKAYAKVNTSAATKLLKAQGFKKGSDGYFQPNYGPEKNQDLAFTISTTTGNTTRASTEQLFQAQMKSIGIKINIQNYAAGTFFGTNLPQGLFDIAEFAWVPTPFVSANESIYCSYTSSACGQNWNHFASKAVDKLVIAGASASSPAAETSDYNKADALLWSNMVTLPLYQKPQFFAWAKTAKNIVPNIASVGLPWNGNLWTAS